MIDDPATPLRVDGGELRQLVEGVVVLRGLHRLGKEGPRPVVDVRQDPRGVHPRVVDVDGPHRGIGGHPFPVAGDREMDGVPGGMGVEPAGSAGDDDARRETLDIPLERTMERLVEVVDVEDEVPLGRCEEAEVGEVGVAAELDDDPARRRRRQVRGHREGSPPVEGEGRGRHPAVPDRHQLGGPGDGLLLEEGDGVGSIGRRPPARVGRRRNLGPRDGAGVPALVARRERGHGAGQASAGVVPAAGEAPAGSAAGSAR